MKESSYLLLLTKKGKSLKPLKEIFCQLNGFYTGIGYAFAQKHASLLQEIADNLKETLYEVPLADGQTFASMQQSHKASFFRQKIHEIETILLRYQRETGLEELSEHTLGASCLADSLKATILGHLEEKDRMLESLRQAERMEKTLIELSPPFSIQFVHERAVNFFRDSPPPIPKLVNFLDENGSIQPLIRKGCTGMIVGGGGVGKTHFLTQLGLAITMGTPFLQKYPIEKPGFVFLGLAENTEEDIHRLLQKTVSFLLSQTSAKEKNFCLEKMGQRLAVRSFAGRTASFLQGRSPTAIYEHFLDELKKKEPDEGWSCVILDPISRFLGADAENDNASATAFIEILEKLILELKGKPAVLFGHHMNKSSIAGIQTDQAAARGSSAITDGVRLQINLERVCKQGEREKINMRMVKSNFTQLVPNQILSKDCQGNISLDPSEKESIVQQRIRF